jgi:hypothetical protein
MRRGMCEPEGGEMQLLLGAAVGAFVGLVCLAGVSATIYGLLYAANDVLADAALDVLSNGAIAPFILLYFGSLGSLLFGRNGGRKA